MRQTVAKRIRKQVYGDYSTTDRSYTKTGNGVVMNTGLRKEYQAAKKEYYDKHGFKKDS